MSAEAGGCIERAKQVGERVAEKLFVGRKGHGGGECSRRVLTREDVAAIAQSAYEIGAAEARLGIVPDIDCDVNCVRHQDAGFRCRHGREGDEYAPLSVLRKIVGWMGVSPPDGKMRWTSDAAKIALGRYGGEVPQ